LTGVSTLDGKSLSHPLSFLNSIKVTLDKCLLKVDFLSRQHARPCRAPAVRLMEQIDRPLARRSPDGCPERFLFLLSKNICRQ
jgi:hypothetical protein